MWKREGALNHTPLSAIGIEYPVGFSLIVSLFKRSESMATKIIRLASMTPTAEFGKKGERQARNLVVNCTFAQSTGKFSVTGEKAVFTANLNVPEEDWEKADKDTEECVKAYRKALEDALKSGEFALYGHVVSVSDLTDGKHESVYNTSTKHTITQFAQALETDSREDAIAFLKRQLTRQIERKRFLWEAPQD